MDSSHAFACDESAYAKENAMLWNQTYDPLNNWLLSTLLAALPTLVLLGALAFLRVKTH